MPTKKTRLNHDEKRHLQKLLFTDIDSAEKSYTSRRNHERSDLVDRLTKTPDPDIAALVAQHAEALAAVSRVDKELAAHGFHLSRVHEPPALITDYRDPPPELCAFDAESERGSEQFAALKRDYVLRLFADGEEARALFAKLSQDIAALA